MSAGTLFVVATPIGNLEDITLRALRILREADVIAAEDTRRTARLLAHHGIATSTVSYHEHNRQSRVPQLLKRLAAGESVTKVARDLQLRGRLLYAWRDKVRQGGSAALRGRGRPRKRATAVAAPVAAPAAAPAAAWEAGETGEDEPAWAQRRVAELERKIGQQQVDLDFFRRALQHVRETR